MAATIKIKNSSTASAVPTSSDLVQGELAVNVTDKRLFTENASGTVVELGTNPTILTMGAAGSASAPVITRTGDTNTGIFFPAADTIAFAEGGVEAMRLDSAGNLGLGVTPSASWAASANLQIGPGAVYNNSSLGAYDVSYNSIRTGSNTYVYAQSSLQATRFQQRDGAFNFFTAASGTAGNAISFTQAMTLDASGNLQLGTTSGSGNRLNVVGTGGIRVNEDGASTKILTIRSDYAGVGPAINVTTSDPLLFLTANTERARIDSSGNLLVGTTTTVISEKFNVTAGGSGINTAFFRFNSTDDRSVVIVRHDGATGVTSRKQIAFLNGSGGEVGSISSTGSATAYNTSSDYRLKENIAPMTGALSLVQQLKPCTYTWKSDGSEGQGFIAHELQEVVPECVTGEKDAVDENGNPSYQGIDTSFLVATLTAAIKEQQAIIESLTARIAALEA